MFILQIYLKKFGFNSLYTWPMICYDF